MTYAIQITNHAHKHVTTSHERETYEQALNALKGLYDINDSCKQMAYPAEWEGESKFHTWLDVSLFTKKKGDVEKVSFEIIKINKGGLSDE